MKLRALSYYGNDNDTRFGDCILLYQRDALIVYDCGHEKHANMIKKFLKSNIGIKQVSVVISHNDNDHTNGVCELLEWLSLQEKYEVKVYSHQYLKHVDLICDKIQDKRRNRESIKQALLNEFDNIKSIIEKAEECGFVTIEALKGIRLFGCTIAGPTIEEFTDVAAKAVDNRQSNNIGEGHGEETVMNAASVQLKCNLVNGEKLLLCGDASPKYIDNMDVYSVIQLPHHGQLEDAIAVFKGLKDPYSKTFLVSDNTGSSTTSGGSEKLEKYMKEERYDSALNTKYNEVCYPYQNASASLFNKHQGVRLGEVVHRI